MTKETTDLIIMGALTTSVLPFLFAFLKDLFANIMIACMNLAKGKPTFRVGTKFPMVLMASGKVFKDVYIKEVDFSTVYLQTAVGVLPVKKNNLRTSNGIIVLV